MARDNTLAFVVEAKNRRDLLSSIDLGLITSGSKIRGGSYEVTIRRLSKKEVAEIHTESSEAYKDDK
jgi:hypothetical protein